LAFSQVARVGPVRARRLHEEFGSLSEAWQASQTQLERTLDVRTAGNVVRARNSVDPLSVLDRLERQGIAVVAAIDPDYPRLLAQIPAAPAVLYVRGTLLPRDELAIAVVGTRRATSYGREIVQQIARDLAAAGVTVVSGLARGIDGMAHLGALEGGGRTIAVLASGVDVIYPAEHANLAAQIAASGAVISDYPPGTKPDAPNFPARNRIISGLALATVVVEAPSRSGALITVDFAADQGREVFVVPGPVTAAASAGSNRLIREGARLVTSAEDILDDLGLPGLDTQDEAEPELSDSERRLIAVMAADPAHLDEIVIAAGLSPAEGAGLMTMLELKGAVRNIGAQHYILTRSKRRSGPD
jgi:DNA processing protein